MANRPRSGCVFLILLTLVLWTAPVLALAENDDIVNHPNCPICGMDRQMFAHSRMLVHYADGSRFAACSLHCVALELAYYPGRVPVKIEVADYGTRRLVDAEAATWVIGGKPAGVMTTTAKWAFADAADARQFIAGQGGEIASFDTAMAAAYAQMHTDTRMIREKRKHMQKGKMPHGQHAND